MVNEIKTTLDKYKNSLDNFKFLYSAQLMREVCGRENIDMAADIHLEGFKPVQRVGRSYTMEQVVSFYYDEITDRFSVDIINEKERCNIIKSKIINAGISGFKFNKGIYLTLLKR